MNASKVHATALLGTLLVIGVMTCLDMRRFLAHTPILRSQEDMEGFRRLVGRNMYGGVVLMTATVLVVLSVAFHLYQGWITWDELEPVFCRWNSARTVRRHGQVD